MQIKAIIAGTGALGAAAVGGIATLTGNAEPQSAFSPPGTTISVERPEPLKVSLTAKAAVPSAGVVAGGADIEFCFPGVLPGPACHDREAILALEDRPFDRAGSDGGPRFVNVEMAHPTDMDVADRSVSRCGEFAALRGEGWGAITNAGLAKEARFVRYCGLITMARLVEPARTTQFDGPMSIDDLEAVPVDGWPSFGEQRPERPVLAADTEVPGRFEGQTSSLLFQIQGVAHGDFDKDGQGEQLLHIGVRVRGGSAGFGSFAILEKDAAGTRLRPVDWE